MSSSTATTRASSITGLDDPKLKDLKIGVFQTSGIRMALARRGIVDNLKLQTQTHDADIVLENQPWYIVQRMLNGEFDVAAVFGPFAGWVKTMKGEPITILPVNMMDDQVPLEFELGHWRAPHRRLPQIHDRVRPRGSRS